ncbi:helix-turn-helix transcriptional regulator [Turicibacter sanguinis]|uniref:helix-turn-helix transcriptional regulator n=1 Tax=Turicibacter sanguinis TaxID=154288 RepID=UPI0021D4E6DF|nr:helix-turn-helix domain-containing protein [Turicibacter sanguinis]MCU7192403.1 helix-turn-helix domain-containing protein [Turicibacter sanguinis]
MLELRELRGQKTQKEIADLLGITSSHYGFIENGTRNPSLYLALKIALLFDVKVEDIFFTAPHNN